MSKKISSRSGGIDIDGDVNSQGDLVGRDKIIQNIIILGEFLDYAGVEGLLPKSSVKPNYTSITDAFESTLGKRLENDLAAAFASAGEIIGDILVKWRQETPTSNYPIRNYLVDIAPTLVRKMQDKHYWEVFAETAYTSDSGTFVWDNIRVIWLYSLRDLWNKYFKEKTLYGIAEIDLYQITGGTAKFVRNEQFFVQPTRSGEVSKVHSFGKLRHEQSRVFLTGLVLDLIRIAHTTADDAKFIDGLIELLVNKK
jgi:hypothetical protein